MARTWNLPTGDYAEYLVSKLYEGQLNLNSNKGIDVDAGEKQIQVKSRVVSDPPLKGENDLSAIRSWHFTHLALIRFEAVDFSIREARLIPLEVAEDWRRRADHTNADTVTITKERLLDSRCDDITERIRVVASSLGGR